MSGNNKKQIFKRKFISLEEKISILDRIKCGEKPSSIAKSLNLNEATIRTILKNEREIRKNVAAGCPQGAKRVSRKRDINIVKMEHALVIWIEDCLDKKIPLSTNTIKQKALRIYTHLKKNELSSNEKLNPFLASKGWFENFKKRFSLRNIKFQGEQASADAEAAQKYMLEILQIIEEGKYSADQIFNADETALYWKKLPSRTFISKTNNQAPGYKLCKDRVTLHMCSNLSGNFVVKSMIINRTLNPWVMKNLDKSHLPVF